MLDSCQLNVYRSLTPLSTIFSYILPVSFIFLAETWIIGDNHQVTYKLVLNTREVT